MHKSGCGSHNLVSSSRLFMGILGNVRDSRECRVAYEIINTILELQDMMDMVLILSLIHI